jgi:ubiquinone/menaquinone biosynthesis C-methylase UbiE
MLTDAKPTPNLLAYGHRSTKGQGEPVVSPVINVDDAKLEAFMGQALGDLGAAISGLMVYLGDKLGLYKAMAGAGPVTPAALAASTETDERYVREWLDNQAAGGYVTYDAAARTYELPPEQALALADEDSPAFLPGGFTGIVAAYVDADTFVDAFRTGRGVGWHEHDGRLFLGTERLFRPGYKGYLASEWIPALDGVDARLRAGATAADVGCGHGASTILMAQAYPASRFVGYDYHASSIDTARARASEAGVTDRVRFEVASAKDYPHDGYDLITFFDCLHDMGDPVGAAVHARRALADSGTVMLVEPFAGDRPEDNHNPVGRAFYGFSTVICTMASRAQEVGLALGAQAGEARIREIFEQAGFSSFRRATETPMNIVFEAKV